MRKIILILVLVSVSLMLRAQDYKIVSVEELPLDMTAVTEDIKVDENGKRCAVLRIVTQNISPEQRDGFYFDGDMGSYVVDRVNKGGDILLWVSPGIKTLKIMHKTWSSYDLHFNNYDIRVKPLKTYKIIIQGTMVDPAQVIVKPEVLKQYLVFQISPANATLEVDGEIWPMSWDGKASKRVELGVHRYRVSAQSYQSIEDSVVFDDANHPKTLMVRLEAAQTPSHQDLRWETFVTVNGGYWPITAGVSIGRVKRFGWFVSLMSNASFTSFSTSGSCDAQGFLNNGALPLYSGNVKTDRHSVIAGGMMRLAGPLCARLGVGYGMVNYSWEDIEGHYYLNKGESLHGVDVSGGLQLNLGHCAVSIEAVSTNFKTIEGKIGIGMAF